MVRVAGVILDSNKHVVIALRKIYGIGKVSSYYICKKANVLPSLKVNQLDDSAIASIQKVVSEFDIEGNLRTRIRFNIKRLKDIKSYRGIRHKVGLPVRGQRTRTNARTRKRLRKKS
jgi:small subunit ribosomal protein S13